MSSLELYFKAQEERQAAQRKTDKARYERIEAEARSKKNKAYQRAEMLEVKYGRREY